MSRGGDVASFRHPWAKKPDDDPASLRASIDRHPSSDHKDAGILTGWPSTTEIDNVTRLDDRRPGPDTVAAFGKLIVSIAGGDKDRQHAITTEFVGVTGSLHEFVGRHIDEGNAADFLRAVECIVEEKLQLDNDK